MESKRGTRVDLVDLANRVGTLEVEADNEKETPNLPKGLLEINAGDQIDYLCDYRLGETIYQFFNSACVGGWQFTAFFFSCLDHHFCDHFITETHLIQS